MQEPETGPQVPLARQVTVGEPWRPVTQVPTALTFALVASQVALLKVWAEQTLRVQGGNGAPHAGAIAETRW